MNERRNNLESGMIRFWIAVFVVVCLIGIALWRMNDTDTLRNRLISQVTNWLVSQKEASDAEIDAAMSAVSILVSGSASVDYDKEATESHSFVGIGIPQGVYGAKFGYTAMVYLFAGTDQSSNPIRYERDGKNITVFLPHTQLLPHLCNVDVRMAHTQVLNMGAINRVGAAIDACQTVIAISESLAKEALKTSIERVGPGLVQLADSKQEQEARRNLRDLGFEDSQITIQWVTPIPLTIH